MISLKILRRTHRLQYTDYCITYETDVIRIYAYVANSNTNRLESSHIILRMLVELDVDSVSALINGLVSTFYCSTLRNVALFEFGIDDGADNDYPWSTNYVYLTKSHFIPLLAIPDHDVTITVVDKRVSGG